MKTQLTIPYHPFHFGSYNIHIIAISLIFITACSVFKEKSFYQADSLLRRNTKTEIKSEVQTHSQALRIYSSEDSADKQSYTEIFPEGIFRYSAQEGFHGKAKRLVINERLKEGKKVRDSAELIEVSKLKEEMKVTDRTITQTRLKEKAVKTNRLNLIYLGGCVIVFVGVFVFRRFMGRV